MRLAPIALTGLCAIMSVAANAQPAATETIVLLRHGEKPAAGLGQLNCQGLNRALALPAVIARDYGRPDAIFAPNPADQKPDAGLPYDYVRPLATIEPTAIAMGLPVNASIGLSQLDLLRQTLETAPYRTALVVVAWEHNDIVKLARMLVAGHGGDPASVPDWSGSDYDSIYVVHLNWTGPSVTIAFNRAAQGLDGQSALCPGAAPR